MNITLYHRGGHVRLTQVDHDLFGPGFRDKWYCSASKMGQDNELVHRYLGLDGNWHQTCQYHNSETDISQLLSHADSPDFHMSESELMGRQSLRDLVDYDYDRFWYDHGYDF